MDEAIRGFSFALRLTLLVLSSQGMSAAQDETFTMLNAIHSEPAGLPRANLARRLIKLSSWQTALAYRDSDDLDISLAANWRCLELQVVADGITRNKREKSPSNSDVDAYVAAIEQRLGVRPPPQWTGLLKSVQFSPDAGLTVLPRLGFGESNVPNDFLEGPKPTVALLKTGDQWLATNHPASGENYVSVCTDGSIISPYEIMISHDSTNLLDSLSGRPKWYGLPYLIRVSDGSGALLAFDPVRSTLVIESLFQNQSNEKWTTEIKIPPAIAGMKGGPSVHVFGTVADAKIYNFVACYASIGIIVLDRTTGNIQNLFWSQGPFD